MANKVGLPVLLTLTLGAFVVQPIAARGPVMTGMEVLEACGIPNESWISFCNGYVQAAFDAAHQPDKVICPPLGTTRAQMAQLVYEVLLANPELHPVAGPTAVAFILTSAYPCVTQ